MRGRSGIIDEELSDIPVFDGLDIWIGRNLSQCRCEGIWFLCEFRSARISEIFSLPANPESKNYRNEVCNSSHHNREQYHAAGAAFAFSFFPKGTKPQAPECNFRQEGEYAHKND